MAEEKKSKRINCGKCNKPLKGSSDITVTENIIATQNALLMPLKKLTNPNNGKSAVNERRRFARAAKNLAIKLEDKEVDFVTETKNISCIGAYCQVDTYLPILTKLKITLLLPKDKNSKTPKHITCEGTVVRVEKCADTLETNKYNIAIYFNQISRNDMKLIDSYVKKNFNPSGPIL